MIISGFADEILEGDVKYFCANCGDFAERAIKEHKISRLPSHLVLTLTRFFYDVSAKARKKRFDKVDIPFSIQFPKQLLTTEHADQETTNTYQLYAVIVHSVFYLL